MAESVLTMLRRCSGCNQMYLPQRNSARTECEDCRVPKDEYPTEEDRAKDA